MNSTRMAFRSLFEEIERLVDEANEADLVMSFTNELRAAVAEATLNNGSITIKEGDKRPWETVEEYRTLKSKSAGVLYDIILTYKDGNSVLEDCTRKYKLGSVFLDRRFPVGIFMRNTPYAIADTYEDYEAKMFDALKADTVFLSHIARAKAFVHYDKQRRRA